MYTTEVQEQMLVVADDLDRGTVKDTVAPCGDASVHQAKQKRPNGEKKKETKFCSNCGKMIT